MIRDYSEQMKETLKQLTQAVVPDKPWETVFDWIGDNYVSLMKRFFKQYDIKDYLDNISEYHAYMINKDDISAEKIDEIFANVETVDTCDEIELGNYDMMMRSLGKMVSQYAGAIKISNGSFCSQSALTAIDSSPDKDDYDMMKTVTDYERKNPETAAAVNKAFAGMINGADAKNKDGSVVYHPGVPDDVMAIKHTIYTAEEPYRSLFTKHIGDVTFLPTDGEAKFSNGDPRIIYINWNDPGLMEDNSMGPYAGVFHEYGHYLDEIYSLDNKQFLSDSFDIQKATDKDVATAVRNKVAEMNPGKSDEFIQDVTDRITKGNLPGYVDDDSQEVIDAAKAAVKELNTELTDAHAGMADTYDGSTNALDSSAKYPIPPEYESKNSGKGVGAGHPNDYYFRITVDPNTQEVTIGERKFSGSCETFAHYFAQRMIGWDRYTAAYDKFLPETEKTLDEVIDYMVEHS